MGDGCIFSDNCFFVLLFLLLLEDDVSSVCLFNETAFLSVVVVAFLTATLASAGCCCCCCTLFGGSPLVRPWSGSSSAARLEPRIVTPAVRTAAVLELVLVFVLRPRDAAERNLRALDILGMLLCVCVCFCSVCNMLCSLGTPSLDCYNLLVFRSFLGQMILLVVQVTPAGMNNPIRFQEHPETLYGVYCRLLITFGQLVLPTKGPIHDT